MVAEGERQPLFYRNPMDPTITSPMPAKDSMGMDYIPVYADGDAEDDVAGTVEIDPVVVRRLRPLPQGHSRRRRLDRMDRRDSHRQNRPAGGCR